MLGYADILFPIWTWMEILLLPSNIWIGFQSRSWTRRHDFNPGHLARSGLQSYLRLRWSGLGLNPDHDLDGTTSTQIKYLARSAWKFCPHPSWSGFNPDRSLDDAISTEIGHLARPGWKSPSGLHGLDWGSIQKTMTTVTSKAPASTPAPGNEKKLLLKLHQVAQQHACQARRLPELSPRPQTKRPNTDTDTILTAIRRSCISNKLSNLMFVAFTLPCWPWRCIKRNFSVLKIPILTNDIMLSPVRHLADEKTPECCKRMKNHLKSLKLEKLSNLKKIN